MNTNELRQKSAKELKLELQELQRSYFSLRVQKATQQLSNTSAIKIIRKSIARTKTILNEKMSAGALSSDGA